MTTRKAVGRIERSSSLVPDSPAEHRPQLTLRAAPVTAIRKTGSVDTLEVTPLLEEAERVAGLLQHVAAITESLSGEQSLSKESFAFLAARHETISGGLSDVIAFYGVGLQSSVENFRRRNAAELSDD